MKAKKKTVKKVKVTEAPSAPVQYCTIFIPFMASLVEVLHAAKAVTHAEKYSRTVLARNDLKKAKQVLSKAIKHCESFK